ncbi:hypothetical protein Z043_110619 [Scleropages formosus]|uniref:Uncharacterized protein n=1 Tax=Scleropages formosus TaxID=113540 RepID=A0A0P7V6R9_SCLFO|nr:hypothetical protein Z043_110619 [Scleropages formosus]
MSVRPRRPVRETTSVCPAVAAATYRSEEDFPDGPCERAPRRPSSLSHKGVSDCRALPEPSSLARDSASNESASDDIMPSGVSSFLIDCMDSSSQTDSCEAPSSNYPSPEVFRTADAYGTSRKPVEKDPEKIMGNVSNSFTVCKTPKSEKTTLRSFSERKCQTGKDFIPLSQLPKFKGSEMHDPEKLYEVCWMQLLHVGKAFFSSSRFKRIVTDEGAFYEDYGKFKQY